MQGLHLHLSVGVARVSALISLFPNGLDASPNHEVQRVQPPIWVHQNVMIFSKLQKCSKYQRHEPTGLVRVDLTNNWLAPSPDINDAVTGPRKSEVINTSCPFIVGHFFIRFYNFICTDRRGPPCRVNKFNQGKQTNTIYIYMLYTHTTNHPNQL